MPYALFAALLINAACLSVALFVGPTYGISPSAFYRDPAAVLEADFAIGWFSNLGAMCWFGAATACLFAASLVGKESRMPVLVFGVITLALGSDDLFMIHDGLALFLGLKGSALYLVYGLALAAWAVRYRLQILRTPWAMLAVAIAFLGVSAVADVVVDTFGLHGDPAFLVEDVSKLFGIILWSSYGIAFAWRVAMRASPVRTVPGAARPEAVGDAHA